MAKIVLNASDIAALAGMHDFKTQEDAVRELLGGHRFGKRRRVIERCETQLKEISEETVVQAAASMGVDVARPLVDIKTEVVRRVQGDAMNVASGKAAVVDVPAPLRELAARHVGMAKGTVQEGSILERAAVQDPHLLTAKPGKMECMDLGSCRLGRMMLRGVADAVDEKRRYVVEVKRRRNRLFGSIPTYERIQLEAYMRLYDILDGVLVESFSDALDMHWVERDDQLWDEVVLAVRSAIDDAEEA